ncbi:MAG: hypothetical protein JWN48_5709 [Myxococcaceae bacterium]|nr:hypothetical protein [Myxococcaceae bacterium]
MLRLAASLGTLLVLLLALPTASAQLPLQVNGLRGGRYVGSAGTISSAPRAVLGLGYAYTEGVLNDNDRHHRVAGEVAGAWAPWQYLQLSLGLDARYDAHHGDVSGSDSGGAFGTRLATRHAFQLSKQLAVAGRTAVHFPASARAALGFRAASPEFGAIGTYLFGRAMELSVDLGYRVDRSRYGVRHPELLSAADRLGASLSGYDAALVGALFAMPIGPVTATAEWSWEIATGSGAPSALESPMRARLAGQLPVADLFVPGFELGVSPSARPPLEKLARIEPRFWAAVTLGLVFEPKAKPKVVGPAAATPVVEQLEDALLDVHVLDPAGAPIANAQVALQLDQTRQELTTSAEGNASFTLAAGQVQSLMVVADGFEPHQAQVEGTRGRQSVTVTLSRKLPEGEIKGTVRSLRGGKLTRAHITVEPLGKSVDTDQKGDFLIAVPPGQYTLQITAPGHEPQERSAQVELLGVTILVVDLRRAPK